MDPWRPGLWLNNTNNSTGPYCTPCNDIFGMQRSFYVHLRVLEAPFAAVLFIYVTRERKMGPIAEENYVRKISINGLLSSQPICVRIFFFALGLQSKVLDSIRHYRDGDASPNAKFATTSLRQSQMLSTFTYTQTLSNNGDIFC